MSITYHTFFAMVAVSTVFHFMFTSVFDHLHAVPFVVVAFIAFWQIGLRRRLPKLMEPFVMTKDWHGDRTTLEQFDDAVMQRRVAIWLVMGWLSYLISLVTVTRWEKTGTYFGLQLCQVIVVASFLALLLFRVVSWQTVAYVFMVETGLISFASASLAGPYASEVLANMYVMDFLIVLAVALTENIVFGFGYFIVYIVVFFLFHKQVIGFAEPHMCVECLRAASDYCDLFSCLLCLFVLVHMVQQNALRNRMLQRHFENAAAMKDEMLSVVSHELKSPLNGLLASLSLLLQSNTENETSSNRKQEQLLRVARHCAGVLELTVSNVLAQKESALDLSWKQLQVQEFLSCIGDIAKALRYHEGGEEIENVVDVFCDDNVPELCKVPAVLHHILVNFCSNAVKFGPPNGHVTLVARVEGAGRLLCEVHDQGPGVHVEFRQRLFQAYSRDWDRTRASGTGLGLFICKKMADAVGGEVGYRNSNVCGSIFWVAVPMQEGVAPVKRLSGFLAPRTPQHVEESTLSKECLSYLLVDDSTVNLHVMESILLRIDQGLHISSATNGLEAIHFLTGNGQSHCGDHTLVVFMDLMMPVMNGLTAARLWRQVEEALPQKRAYLVAVSASQLTEAIPDHFDNVLNKPITLERMRTFLRQLTFLSLPPEKAK